MFNVCPRCGEYSDEKEVEPTGPWAICPHCDYRHRFLRLPLFVVTGASGSGKTSVAMRLMAKPGEYVCLDSDVLWRPEFNTPEDGYRAFRDFSLRIAKNIGQAGRPVVLMAGGVPDQYEACPERRYFAELHYLALVCDDGELVNRLMARPSWRMSASPQLLAQERSFNTWLRENAAKTAPPMSVLDTGAILIEETTRRVSAWIASPR